MGIIASSIKFAQAAIADQELARLQGAATNRALGELTQAAKESDANAVDAIKRGSIQAGALKSQGTAALEAQRLAFTAGGVDATSGTAAQMSAATRAAAEMDAMVAQNDAMREAMGFRVQARKYRQQYKDVLTADAAQTEARAAKVWGAWADAAGSMFGMAGGK